MATVAIHREHKPIRKTTLGSVIFEASAALTALVLGVAYLAHAVGPALVAVAAIALGSALMFQGLAVGSLLRRTGTSVMARVEPETAEIGIESLAGVVGITLGVLALAGVGASHVLPVAAIVLGTGLMFAQCPLAETTSGDECVTEDGKTTKGTYSVAMLSSVLHAFVGMGAVVLGVIQLAMGVASLTAVAFVAIGAAMLAACAAIGMRATLQRQH
jgi:hypothetical protein